MHESVYQWVQQRAHELKPPVLEVGSRNVNGSVRDLCPTPYVGCDVVMGPGVDVKYMGIRLPADDESQQTVICTEVFEHCAYPHMLAGEIVRVLVPGGRALVTARGNGFPYHEPPDRWRYMPGTLSDMFEGLECSSVFESEDPQEGHPGVFVDVTK